MTNFKTTIKRLPCFVMALVILSTAAIISGCSGTTIDVKGNYLLDVDFSGCNGHGKVEFSVNSNNIGYALNSISSNDNYSEVYNLLSAMKFKMEDESKNGSLSNGDKFTVKTEYDIDKAQELGITLSNTDIECTVAELPEGVELDAFAKVKVEFSGDNGSGYVSINTDSCPKEVKNNLYFEIDGERYNLSNGDKVTVVVNAFGNLEDKGYFLKEEEKTFTVEGLSGAKTTLEGVDCTSVANDMKDKLDDEIDSEYDLAYLDYKFESGKKRDLSSYGFDYTAKAELVNYVYAYEKDDIDNNGLVAVYKVTNKVKRTDSDQTYVDDGATAMKKNETDTGVTYIAIMSSALKITADNKIVDDYIYYSAVNYVDLNELNQKFVDSGYTTVSYDKDFNDLKSDLKSDSSSEKSTENSTEKATEKTTESNKEDATKEASSKVSDESATAQKTEHATTKKA